MFFLPTNRYLICTSHVIFLSLIANRICFATGTMGAGRCSTGQTYPQRLPQATRHSCSEFGHSSVVLDPTRSESGSTALLMGPDYLFSTLNVYVMLLRFGHFFNIYFFKPKIIDPKALPLVSHKNLRKKIIFNLKIVLCFVYR